MADDKNPDLQKIEEEIRRLEALKAQLSGGGAIAQGDGAKAVGAGGMLVEGGLTINQAPDLQKIEVDKIKAKLYAYLEWVQKRCQVLRLAALSAKNNADEDITLDDVYVDLDTSIDIQESDLEDLRTGRKTRLFESGAAKELDTHQERASTDKAQPLPLWDAVRFTPRAVILGDPGSGKSTFAHKVLGMQAMVMRNQGTLLPGFDADLLPVLIILRELALNLDPESLAKLSDEARTKALLNHFRQYLERELKIEKIESAIPLVDRALARGRVLLVLDGLDEVPQNLRGTIRQLAGALLSHYRVARLMITSRIRSYAGSAVFENLQTFTIRPFTRPKIESFIKGWYRTKVNTGQVSEKDREKQIRDLTQAALSRNLAEISSNPMMLTSMAIIHQEEVTLPRERVRLYKLVVDVLLRRWQKQKLGEGKLTPSEKLAAFLMDGDRILDAMERLAYEAHLSAKGKKGSADLLRMRAVEILEDKRYLNDMGLANEFLNYVDQRAGLLKGNGGETEKTISYSFPHRIFQEYLAGCYMVRERDPWREYRPRAAEGDYWAIAAQLGAEELYFNNRSGKYTAIDLAYHLLADEVNTEQDARLCLWSSQITQIVDLDEIRADKENGGEKYLRALPQRLLSALESKLPAIERTQAGNTLSALGDPRFNAEMWQLPNDETLGFVRIPAGKFLMGSDDKYDNEKPQHEVDLPEYWMARYPVTVAQFRAFTEATKYSFDLWKYNLVPTQPIVAVSWYDALEYTKWLDGELRLYATKQIQTGISHPFWQGLAASKLQVTLPSEAEWEKAARGSDGRIYPWGNDFDAEKANTTETQIGDPSAVGCFPSGINGLFDMSGNVWEWTRSLWGKDWSDPEYQYPYNPQDAKREELNASKEILRVLRGGSFSLGSDYARCAYRYWFLPDLSYGNFGFRVVLVSPILPSRL